MSRGPPYWTVTLSVYVPGQIKIHLDAVPDPRAATAEETVSYWVDDGLLPCTSRHPPGLDVREARLWIDRLRCFSGRVGDVFATREKALRSNQKIEYILRFLKNWNRTYIDDQRFSICEETFLVCIWLSTGIEVMRNYVLLCSPKFWNFFLGIISSIYQSIHLLGGTKLGSIFMEI